MNVLDLEELCRAFGIRTTKTENRPRVDLGKCGETVRSESQAYPRAVGDGDRGCGIPLTGGQADEQADG